MIDLAVTDSQIICSRWSLDMHNVLRARLSSCTTFPLFNLVFSFYRGWLCVLNYLNAEPIMLYRQYTSGLLKPPCMNMFKGFYPVINSFFAGSFHT